MTQRVASWDVDGAVNSSIPRFQNSPFSRCIKKTKKKERKSGEENIRVIVRGFMSRIRLSDCLGCHESILHVKLCTFICTCMQTSLIIALLFSSQIYILPFHQELQVAYKALIKSNQNFITIIDQHIEKLGCKKSKVTSKLQVTLGLILNSYFLNFLVMLQGKMMLTVLAEFI